MFNRMWLCTFLLPMLLVNTCRVVGGEQLLSPGRAVLSFSGTAMRSLYEIAMSPDGQFVLSRGFDGFGKLWDLQQNSEALPLFTYGFAFAPAGDWFVSTSLQKPGMSLIRCSDQREFGVVSKGEQVSQFAIDPAGQLLATTCTGSDQGERLILWNADSCAKVLTINFQQVPKGQRAAEQEAPAESPTVTALQFAESADVLLIGFSDGNALALNLKAGVVTDRWSTSDCNPLDELRLVGSVNHGIAGYGRDRLRRNWTAFWRPGNNRPVWQLKGQVSFAPDGQFGVVAREDGDVSFIDSSTGRELAGFRGYVEGTKWWPIRHAK